MTEIAITAGRTPALTAPIADHGSTPVTLSLAVTKPLSHRSVSRGSVHE